MLTAVVMMVTTEIVLLIPRMVATRMVAQIVQVDDDETCMEW